MPDKRVLDLLNEIATRPKRGEPGYECPDHPPSQRCMSCIDDDEWEAVHGLEARPCGCLTYGEDCDKCRTDPIDPPGVTP